MTALRPGCWNKPRPTAETMHMAQDGWFESHHNPDDTINMGWKYPQQRIARLVPVPFSMSTTCKYDKSATDAGCSGCEHGAKPW